MKFTNKKKRKKLLLNNPLESITKLSTSNETFSTKRVRSIANENRKQINNFINEIKSKPKEDIIETSNNTIVELIIRGLTHNHDVEMIRTLCLPYGKVANLNLIQHPKNKAVAYVSYFNAIDARKAIGGLRQFNVSFVTKHLKKPPKSKPPILIQGIDIKKHQQQEEEKNLKTLYKRNVNELDQQDLDYLHSLLGNDLSHTMIREIMAFVLDNNNHIEECLDLILKDFTLDTLFDMNKPNSIISPVTITQRLYILSDILANCSNEDKYIIMQRLPDFFLILHYICNLNHNQLGIMTIGQVKLRVESVLKVWEHNMIFSDVFLIGLEYTFINGILENSNTTANSNKQFDNAIYSKLAVECLSTGLSIHKSTQNINILQARLNRFKQYLTESTMKKELIDLDLDGESLASNETIGNLEFIDI